MGLVGLFYSEDSQTINTVFVFFSTFFENISSSDRLATVIVMHTVDEKLKYIYVVRIMIMKLVKVLCPGAKLWIFAVFLKKLLNICCVLFSLSTAGTK